MLSSASSWARSSPDSRPRTSTSSPWSSGTLDADTLARHYEEHVGKGFYGELVEFMSRGPVVAMVIEGPEDTWEVVRTMMGATNPRKADTRHHPRRPRHPLHREPRARQRLARERRARDRDLLPQSVTFRDWGSWHGWRAGTLHLRQLAKGGQPMARNNPLSLGRDLAIDLGTANTLIYVRGHGVVLDEPSVVAINVNDGRPVAVGMEAKRMMGRTPNHIKAIRPLKDGVIADFEVCEKMLRYFIQKVAGSKWSKPRMVICVPSGITGVEQRAVQDAAEYAGARKPVHIIEEPMAAAIGADMPVHEPSGNMIVDIGGGTTEVAVISLGGIVTAQSIRVAGDELDEAVLQYVKKEFSLAIGDRTAEEIKIQMGSAWPLEMELTADIRGRDLISGLPRTIQITTEQVREAVAEPISAIVDAVKTTLDKTPPELAADIMEDGITITGGGALLGGLDQRLAHETGMPIRIADEPLYSVVIGSGRALENIDAMRGLMSLGGED
jgi:rod shape-determining protein MreB and related proteins